MERKTLFKTILYKETGSRHIERNKNCEDNVFRYISENGITSIALSDGAGSYKYAEKGSEITARMAATFMAKKFERLYGLDNETIADYVIREVLIPLGEEAEKQGEDIIEFSATLLCTAFHPDGRYLILHVGDGAIVGLNKNNECEVSSIYEHDGPANQTTFVTVPDTQFFLKKGTSDYSSVVLMSDGPEEFLVNELGANVRIRLMQQMAFFLSEADMENQISSLIRLLVNNGMGDDASFAVICNMKETGNVLSGLSPEFRRQLFDLQKDLSDKKMDNSKKLLAMIGSAPNGTTIGELTRNLHIHSKSITKKKLNHLLVMELIKQENGRIYIAD